MHEGAFDWMGVAHMLGLEGTVAELRELAPLDAGQLLLFGWGHDQARPFEREQIERRGLENVPLDAVAADPAGAAAGALERFGSRFDRLLVHFDVDIVDFTDAPLSENTGRNEGLALDAALEALSVLLGAANLSALTITELNPLHGDEETLRRFVTGLADAFAPPD